MKILYNYTTRSRPEFFKRGLASIIDNSESPNYHILVSIDRNDTSMNNAAMWVFIENTPRVTMVVGDSKNKIDAINRDVNGFDYDWDVIVNMSDDMVFDRIGFDNIIRKGFDKFGISLDTCLHFPDGNRRDLITMAIMGREYYERFNYIYHPSYKSLYCDDEMTIVSKKLNCWKYINEDIFKHLHPAFGKAPNDPQYFITESFGGIDKVTFESRKANNFDL